MFAVIPMRRGYNQPDKVFIHTDSTVRASRTAFTCTTRGRLVEAQCRQVRLAQKTGQGSGERLGSPLQIDGLRDRGAPTVDPESNTAVVAKDQFGLNGV